MLTGMWYSLLTAVTELLLAPPNGRSGCAEQDDDDDDDDIYAKWEGEELHALLWVPHTGGVGACLRQNSRNHSSRGPKGQ